LRPAATLACLALLAGACEKQSSPALSPAPPQARAASTHPPAWTPERVREFVVDTEQLVYKLRSKQLEKHGGAQAKGECYGEAAYPLGQISEIVPALETRLTGHALRCYLASYFGCRMGDSVASAGISLDGPRAVSFNESRTTILEQTADRIVAQMSEAPSDMVLLGKLTKEADGKTEHKHSSRYTLTRDAKGVWRISDRIPSFKEWECREK
jgi:hypothetical protein